MPFFPFPVPNLPNPTAASSPSYDGTPSPAPTDAGVLSCGSFDAQDGVFPTQVLQAVRAPVRVILPAASNPILIKQGPQEYFATLSLSGTSTLQLTPGMADSQNNPVTAVAPNVFNSFVYRSRNNHVCTVNSNGLVTGVSRGEAVVLIGSSRNANLPFTNAAPPAGLTGAEIYCEVIVRVTA
jgi:hypothetical protein